MLAVFVGGYWSVVDARRGTVNQGPERAGGLMKRPLATAVAGACLVATVAAGSVTAAAPPFTVVTDGLWNPRGLTFGPSGTLYVAEAGLGGGNAQTGAANGFGPSGRISAISGATG